MTTPPPRGDDQPGSEPHSDPSADQGAESMRSAEPESTTPGTESGRTSEAPPASSGNHLSPSQSTSEPTGDSDPTPRSQPPAELPRYPITPRREPPPDDAPPAGTEYPEPRGYPPFDSSGPAGFPPYFPGGGTAGPTRDPLIPADFGGWFSRIFEVARRNLPQLVVLALIPAAISLAQQLVIISQLPGQQELQQMIERQGPSPDPLALFETLLGPMLPVVVAFSALSIIAGAWVQAASLSMVIRGSNGQHITVGEALRSTIRRVPALVGWSLVAGLSIMIGFMLVTPGASVGNSALAALGILIAIALAAYLTVTFFGSLLGAVVVERQGIARCFTLVRDRWWATFGRLAAVGVLTIAYFVVVTVGASALSTATSTDNALTGASSALSSGSVIVAVLEAVLMIPVMVVFVGVFTVTYAELRFHENKATTTATLAAELDAQ